MNLFLRLLYVLFFRKHSELAADMPSHSRFRVYRIDCDLNGHLTNSRYASFMDLARVGLFQDLGLINHIYSKRAMPVLQSSEITFIKEIKPGALVDIHSQLLGVDHKYLYIQQAFYVEDQLMAISRQRAIFNSPSGLVELEHVKEWLEIHHWPLLPTSIETWKQYLVEKKNESTR